MNKKKKREKKNPTNEMFMEEGVLAFIILLGSTVNVVQYTKPHKHSHDVQSHGLLTQSHKHLEF